MEYHEREFFISRIDAGYIRVRINESLVVKIVTPSKDTMYEAQEVFMEEFERARTADMPDHIDYLMMLCDYGVWNEQMEKDLSQIPKNIDEFKVQLYLNLHRPAISKKTRKFLQLTKMEYARLLDIKHSWDHYTAQGIATAAKTQKIIEQSTYYMDGRPYDWSDVSPAQLVKDYQTSTYIAEPIMRELARTEPWLQFWSSRKSNGQIFEGALSRAQTELIMWSSFYDNVRESPDCPTDQVIDDDDLLDGWLILQKRKRDKERKKGEVEKNISSNDKINRAPELYVVIDDTDLTEAEVLEKAREINNLNDPVAERKKRRRLKFLEKHNAVSEGDFPDVQEELRMRLVQMERDKMKGPR